MGEVTAPVIVIVDVTVFVSTGHLNFMPGIFSGFNLYKTLTLI